MKKFVTIRNFLLVIILFQAMASCNKDEISPIGKLSISFSNHPADIIVVIYSIENTTIPINNFQLDSNGKATKDLNIGNYYISVSSATAFEPTGFQIKSNSTTTILWDTNNISKVQ